MTASRAHTLKTTSAGCRNYSSICVACQQNRIKAGRLAATTTTSNVALVRMKLILGAFLVLSIGLAIKVRVHPAHIVSKCRNPYLCLFVSSVLPVTATTIPVRTNAPHSARSSCTTCCGRKPQAATRQPQQALRHRVTSACRFKTTPTHRA